MLGALSHAIRLHRWSVALLPTVFVLEPALVLVALGVLGRPTWSSWSTAAAAEVTLGLVLLAMVLVGPVLLGRLSAPTAP